MEVKKGYQQTGSTSQKDVATMNLDLFDRFAQIKQEFFKISWTEPEELKAYTQIVVGATFVFGIGIFCIDLVIHTLLTGLSSVIHFIGG